MDERQKPDTRVCKRCGLESDIKAAFTKSRTLALKTVWYCPTCVIKKQNRNALLYFLLLPAAGIWLYSTSFGHELGRFLLTMAVVTLMLFPLLLLHELAHVFAAWLLGIEIFGVIIGSGRQLWTGRLANLDWDIRSWPSIAATLVAGLPGKWYRTRMFLVYLSGPLMHLSLAVLLFLAWLFISPWLPPWLAWLILLGWILNGIMFLINLWPHRVPSVIGETGSDGFRILKLFTMNAAALETQRINYYIFKSWSAYKRDEDDEMLTWAQHGLELAPRNITLLNLAGAALSRKYDFDAARQIFGKILELCETDPEINQLTLPAQRALVQNNLAYVLLSLGEPEMLPLAAEYSTQAYKNMPWQPELIATRGAVLVETGQPEQGITLLRAARTQSRDRRAQAENSCYLALGEIQRGAFSAASEELATAKNLDPNCFLIEKVERALVSAPMVE